MASSGNKIFLPYKPLGMLCTWSPYACEPPGPTGRRLFPSMIFILRVSRLLDLILRVSRLLALTITAVPVLIRAEALLCPDFCHDRHY
jgi:hypothetical protein